MQHLNDLGRRKLGGRRWGDNRVPRWGTGAVLLAFFLGIVFGLGAEDMYRWVF